jgi:putative oxidoreductase
MKIIRDLGLLAGRLVLGAYLIAHGAQKLLGTFEGPGLKAASKGFDRIGLRPGIVMATAASVSEIGGGFLTAAGAWSPLGPIALVQTMAVASVTHRAKGPFAAKGGFELALTNLSAALVLAVAGPGRISADHVLGLRLPRWKAWLATLGGLAAAAASIRMMLGAAPIVPETAAAPAASSSASTAPSGEPRMDAS